MTNLDEVSLGPVEAGIAARATAVIAKIMDRIENRPLGTGRNPVPSIKVVEALRFSSAKA
jgi:alkyl hydroperoxide reductase subunit AhpC